MHNFWYTGANSDIDDAMDSGQRQLMSKGLKTQHFNDDWFLKLGKQQKVTVWHNQTIGYYGPSK